MKRKMKSTIICMFLSILVLLEMNRCQGCLKHEREALLALNAKFDQPLTWEGNTDCCQWQQVECNTTTGRVTKLDISLVMYTNRLEKWYLNYSDFVVFEDLKNLILSGNSIAGCVEYEGLRLINLEAIDLSYNSLNNTDSILSCLDGLPSLESLNLSNNEFNETPLHGGLQHLKYLDLSGNYLEGSLNISGLLGSNYLEVLDISNNHIHTFVIHKGGLQHLKYLDLSGNYLGGSFNISGLLGSSNLEILDYGYNDINNFLVHEGKKGQTKFNFINGYPFSSLGGLQHLKYLDLSGNYLEGSLNISGLLGSSNLEILDFGYNDISNFLVHEGSKSLTKLKVLRLDNNRMDGNMLRKSLRPFSSITKLYLSYSRFNGTIVAADFRDLDNLEHLILDFSSNLVNEFFKSIGLLTSLKVLSLKECWITGTLPAGEWYKLKKLEELDLADNKFEGLLPSSFCNMTSLRNLELSGSNNFIGSFSSNIESFTSLEHLDFEGNQFDFPISFKPFANHSNIKFIDGNGNNMILNSHSTLQTWVPKFQLEVLRLSSSTITSSFPLPNFLLYQHNLIDLDFSSWKLKEGFPKWLLENNNGITNLVLRSCSIKGTFQLPSHPHLSIKNIDVSDNAITGEIPSNISSIFPYLKALDMSKNDIHGSIPQNISRDWGISDLRLSNNKLDGTVFPTLSTLNSLEILFLDGNKYSGSIPSSFFNMSSFLSTLDVSNNHFEGKLPSIWTEKSQLMKLYMSNNHFEGSISSDFANGSMLESLDLSRNNLIGSIPRLLNFWIRYIHLDNNMLSGLPKRMFNESSFLQILDLSYNNITNGIQDMVLDINHPMLKILLLKGNHITGNIPKQLCQLMDISILDLSQNSFSGPIPSCLGKLPFDDFLVELGGDVLNIPIIEEEKANFTTKKISYTYTGNVIAYMTGVDLSYNKLSGNIPSFLGNLTKIRAMNLSYNHLTGKIPTTFSNLLQVESLDLSFNNLSGSIPPQLNKLSSLEVFNVAYNNLSGAIPERKGQFMTFDESSYEGNPFLCGPPLPKRCNASILPNGTYTDGDNDSFLHMYFFWVSFLVSYVSVLLVIAVVLYINPYWRRAWFYYIELVSTNCYYFIEDNLC